MNPMLKDFEKYLEPVPEDIIEHWIKVFGIGYVQMIIGLARAQELGHFQYTGKSDSTKRLSFLNQFVMDNYSRLGVAWKKQRDLEAMKENQEWGR